MQYLRYLDQLSWNIQIQDVCQILFRLLDLWPACRFYQPLFRARLLHAYETKIRRYLDDTSGIRTLAKSVKNSVIRDCQ